MTGHTGGAGDWGGKHRLCGSQSWRGNYLRLVN